MANFKKLMQQAATMQKDMQRIQDELSQKTVEFSSGGGMVHAVARGDGSLVSLRIDPRVINPADAELLQDMVIAAANGALHGAKEVVTREMSKVTAGLGLPGMF